MVGLSSCPLGILSLKSLGSSVAWKQPNLNTSTKMTLTHGTNDFKDGKDPLTSKV